MHRLSNPAKVASSSDPPPPPPPVAGGGAAAAVTVRVTDVAGELPAAFAQTIVYVSLPTAVGPIVWLPVLANAPDQLPDAVQPLVLAEDQVMVVELPVTIELCARVSVGATGTIAGTSVAALSACTNP